LKLSIIIVNWNTAELLRQCLNSFIKENICLPFEVIIVDNASSDGSVKMIKNEFPDVYLINNTSNLGFARANNQAIRIAKGEYILLLNSDTIILNRLIFKHMADLMDLNPDAGVCGCRLIFPNGNHQVGDAGFKPSVQTVFNHAFFLSMFFPLSFNGLFLSYRKLSGIVEVDWISGAAFMVRRSILPDVGLLSEKTFMFAEDIEWGCRIRHYGYRILYMADLEIVHLQGASSKKQKNRHRFALLWLKNLRELYRSYNRAHPMVIYDLLFSIAFFLRCFVYVLLFHKTGQHIFKEKFRKMYAYLKYTLKNFGKHNK